jgi:ribose transport system substrate-binding protein
VKTKGILFLVLVALMIFGGMTVMAGGGKETPTTVEEPQETAAELTYEMLREYAKAQKPWPGLPAKGMKLGYAVNFAGNAFGDVVTESIRSSAALAGIDVDKNFFYLDNKADATVALQNSDIMLSKRPDVFIEFQLDAKANAIIAMKFRDAGIPMLAIDIPVPGATFVGVDNFKVAYMAGEAAIELIEERWGGWDAVDLVIMLTLPIGGQITLLRAEGFAQALADKYGPEVEEKIHREDAGDGNVPDAQKASMLVLPKYPKAKNIVLTGIDEQAIAGFQAAAEILKRWNKENYITIGQGVDELGRELIKTGVEDASVAYFPEKYGEFLVPAAVALYLGLPIPSHIFVENVMITKDNVTQYYPE